MVNVVFILLVYYYLVLFNKIYKYVMEIRIIYNLTGFLLLGCPCNFLCGADGETEH